MTWNEFYSAFPYTVSHYPDARNLNTQTPIIRLAIKAQTKHFRTKWKTERHSVEDVSMSFYLNALETIPVCKNMGAHERVEMGVTPFGYLPVRLLSTSPDKTERVVMEFEFEKGEQIEC